MKVKYKLIPDIFYVPSFRSDFADCGGIYEVIEDNVIGDWDEVCYLVKAKRGHHGSGKWTLKKEQCEIIEPMYEITFPDDLFTL